MPFFSFIIPVYNAENVIDRCLKSIEKQIFKDYEVIMIEDGSTDNSLGICEKYSHLYSNWIVKQQSNSGPSKARNEGLNIAKGKYICFLDSDDYISKDYLEHLYREIQINNPDVIFFGYQKEFIDKEAVKVLPKTEYDDKYELCYWLSTHDLFGYTWSKCFSANSIGQHRFKIHMRLFEDEVFTCNVMGKCRTISIIPEAIYHYVVGNNQALTKLPHHNYCFLLDDVYSAWKQMLKNTPSEKYMQNKADSFTAVCRYYGLEQNVDVKQFYSSMKNTAFFKEHTDFSVFDSFVQNEKYIRINAYRLTYRLKQRVYKFLHKK